MMRPLCFITTLIAVGCARPSPVAAPAAAAAPSVDRFVLIWGDAPLHRSPTDEQPVRGFDFGGDARENRPGQVVLARLVGEHDGWLEISTSWVTSSDATGAPYHCIRGGVLGSLADEGWGLLDLRLWVRHADVAPVLTRPFEQAFDDGTFVRLRPGTPIVGGRPWVSGFSLPVEVPPEAVGVAYHAHPPTPGAHEWRPSVEGFSKQIGSEVRASLGGVDAPWTHPNPHAGVPPAVWVDGTGTQIATFKAGCGQAVLAFHGQAAPQDDEGEVENVRIGSAHEVRVSKGAALRWPDGEPAGVAETDLRLKRRPVSSQVPYCFQVVVGRSTHETGYLGSLLDVCTEPTAPPLVP